MCVCVKGCYILKYLLELKILFTKMIHCRITGALVENCSKLLTQTMEINGFVFINKFLFYLLINIFFIFFLCLCHGNKNSEL